MQTQLHPLTATAPGTRRELHSLHFGPTGSPKVLIQASLHADEPPGMLVAFHLRQRLLALEAAGRLRAEVVLLPVANPIGLAQRVLGRTLGRFELSAGENFNRNYADLSARAWALLAPVSASAPPEVAQVRAALRTACAELPQPSELTSLRKTLLGLAIDADIVLDLHCDNEAGLHLYAVTPQWPVVEPLARLLGAELALLSTASGGEPFDESCSMVWAQLNALWSAQFGVPGPWPLACVALTVELRGENDVSHALASRDAEAILAWLQHQGLIEGGPVSLPELQRAPRPLAATMPVLAPCGGVLVHRAALGTEVSAGECIAEVLDPLSGELIALNSPIDGLLFARESGRSIQAGVSVAKIAGIEPRRTGKLLSA